ncbi:hypothetical protein NEIG_02687, partial [Nematocida sp. ERTm5]
FSYFFKFRAPCCKFLTKMQTTMAREIKVVLIVDWSREDSPNDHNTREKPRHGTRKSECDRYDDELQNIFFVLVDANVLHGQSDKLRPPKRRLGLVRKLAGKLWKFEVSRHHVFEI